MPEHARANIRELGGEIWAEVEMEKRFATSSTLSQVNCHAIDEIVDILVGVLARHVGAIIVNDEGLPVTPRPKRSFEND